MILSLPEKNSFSCFTTRQNDKSTSNSIMKMRAFNFGKMILVLSKKIWFWFWRQKSRKLPGQMLRGSLSFLLFLRLYKIYKYKYKTYLNLYNA